MKLQRHTVEYIKYWHNKEEIDIPEYVFKENDVRGCWISNVANIDTPNNLEKDDYKKYLIGILETMQSYNMNTAVFQVRPLNDAYYPSDLNPWSRFITGTEGKDPGFDVLEFFINEAKKRNIKVHAWMNPYRVSNVSVTDGKITKDEYLSSLDEKNFARKHPEHTILDGTGKIILSPSHKEVIEFVSESILEVARKYDVEGVHIDDYFYPYPIKGVDFPDNASFARYGGGFTNKADWRRSNVNVLIKKLHETIRGIKPWVKFGISPFGIYRNQKSDPLGSNTNGLQNYDDLYADVLLWAREGWIDYNIPQIYWEIGHKAADYETLVKWWATHSENRPLFIGQSVTNTIQHADPQNPSMNQLPRKMALQRAYQTIGGSCQWYAAAVVENQGRYRDALVSEYHKYPALIPVFDFMDDKAPDKVRKMKKIWTEDGYVLFWTAPKAETEMDKAVQ